MRGIGIPYQGNKARLVPQFGPLLPKADHFFDLFGGGGSVSCWLLQNRQNDYGQMHYNEILTPVAQLLQDVIAGKYSYSTFKPLWVSREQFHAEKETDGYVRQCWSFGNDGQSYLFGETIEPYKRQMHDAVVFGIFSDLAKDVLQIASWDTEDITERRLFLRRKIEHYRKTNTLPPCLHRFLSCAQLQHLQQLDRLKQLEQLQHLQQLDRLKQLEQLQRLQQLERLEQLSITSKDYRDVEILPNSVIYCDIPYGKGDDYGHSFDRADFFAWARNQRCPVFVSEYSVTETGWQCVWECKTKSSMAAKGPVDRTERIYWNGR